MYMYIISWTKSTCTSTCNNISATSLLGTPEIDSVVELLLTDLVRFQDRQAQD